MKCVKTWCAIAAHALVLMRCPKKEAARCVAEVVNKQKFLLPKRSGISVDPRSVLNWMARWDDGDLKVFNDGWCAFHEAFDLFNQGQPRAARHKLLNVLSDLLDERRNFQMYPEETGSVS